MKALVMTFGVGWGVFGWALAASAQYGGFGGSGGYEAGTHASTLEEGVLRGAADVIRSQGIYNAATGQAAVLAQEASRQAAENRAKWLQTYYDARRMNREYQQEVNRLPDAQSVRRYLDTQRPKRLTWFELGVAGDLHWPAHLMAVKFAPQREQLEKLFRERAYKGILSSLEQSQVDEITEAMIDELKMDIAWVRPSEYVKAKQFLVSLRYEAKQPVA